MILKNELLIRLMNGNGFEVMVKWLNDQRVLEFYEEPPSNIDMVIKKYGPRVEGKHYVIPCIVEYKNEPIGYIQYYEIQENDLKRYGYSANQNIHGIDQFIGETQLWGKGIGTTMILMMLDELSKNKGALSVVLEVKKNNSRAISSYKKCGFRKIKELYNDLYLMEWIKGTH
ncbi:GNAT family N-acetyltransferase [Bacillus sp. NTK034]|uniref:GNAT family N-acetyltransferase n=1 Tax=Bacillus sp. NTK034 TaxID=2802176 RepID=UPI001A8C7F10|nr:GNAT family N-acetyltransferase [Bacillus sp. NTK034]MBN8204175.1 GNAT family N-acetyltransferase [Bacillus sp. NTK034]